MCVLWLGAGIALVWQAQGSEIASKGVATTSGKPFLGIHCNVHLDNLPVQ
jgi:hypothetical protein